MSLGCQVANSGLVAWDGRKNDGCFVVPGFLKSRGVNLVGYGGDTVFTRTGSTHDHLIGFAGFTVGKLAKISGVGKFGG